MDRTNISDIQGIEEILEDDRHDAKSKKVKFEDSADDACKHGPLHDCVHIDKKLVDELK